MSGIQVFKYQGFPVSFDKGENTMVNATEMAKLFGKKATDWLKTQSASTFIATLSEVKNINSSDLVQVTYGDNGGTWMHSDVALEFARWLSPAFAIWTNDRIKELLTTGVATATNDDEAILKAINILQFRLDNAKKRNAELMQEKQMLEGQNEELTERNKALYPKADYTDKVLQSKDTYTMTQMAKELGFGGAPSLIKKLQDMKIIYRQSGMYLLYEQYCKRGLTATRTAYFTKENGQMGTSVATVWTELGRAFLHKKFGTYMKPVELPILEEPQSLF